ncbi:PLP-dependent aminotransferase family protein [Anaeroselena agilis]|uniref:PLP-dependent aminotransferase family protein n=1 Tax=Anaeroselena agilis TaxID=3063788 RepID=A0ABU3P5T9_9FIRM|nr:PLP-dependent aminotransferase family protein [Selenomonadales bacterium 4137-cl]
MLLLTVDEQSLEPIYRQIVAQIRDKIAGRVLLPGERLPSTRRLADQLGIHRSTVATAYQELWALGFIDLSPGSRPRVRDRMQFATAADRGDKGLVDWQTVVSPASEAVWRTYRRLDPLGKESTPALINFASMNMDSRLFPLESFRACLDRAVKNHGDALLGYGARAGFPPLREYIARRLQSHGISVTADEILITNGSQQGIDLVFRMIAAPGKTVAIESPTYDYVLPLLRFYGLRPVEIPIRQGGMDLGALAAAIAQERPVLVYTMPTFQNPTGISTGQAHRERLLSLCEQHRIPILEDGFEEEMKYSGRVVLPIKSMDKRQLVIYCGTFSKVLFPGARVGWLAAEKECVERLVAIHRFSELAPSMILQAAIHEFCQSGHYDRHIGRMHRAYRKRMQTAVRALSRHIDPAWAEWTEPSGGFLIWLKLKPAPHPPPDWKTLLAAHGVEATTGGSFFYGETPDTYLRLSISPLNEEEITEGVRRLAAALRQAHHPD